MQTLELISCLLVFEKNNQLLMKYHKTRLTGYVSFSEMNAAIAISNYYVYERSGGHGHDPDCGHDHERSFKDFISSCS